MFLVCNSLIAASAVSKSITPSSYRRIISLALSLGFPAPTELMFSAKATKSSLSDDTSYLYCATNDL